MPRGPDIVTAIARVTALLSAGPWGCSLTVRSSTRKEKKRVSYSNIMEKMKGIFFPVPHVSSQRKNDTATDVCRESRTKNFDLKTFLAYKLFLHVTTAS